MPTLSKLAIVLAAAAGMAGAAAAQTPCRATVTELSNPTARAQLAELNTRGATTRDVMGDAARCRSDSTAAPVGGPRFPLELLAPVMRVQYVGGVPDVRNDGGAWAGVGLNVFLRLGATWDHGMVHAVVAPEFWYAQNEQFNFFPNTSATRSPFASNLYLPPYSIDLPSRFGASSLTNASLGQSALWVATHDADIGVSNSAQAWGPGIRGHLLLGPDAPGVPRVFVRTDRPINTPVGAWSGTAFVGTLTESPFFDQNSKNNQRTLTSWTVNWSPSATSGTALGLEHLGMQTGSLFGGPQGLTGPTDQMNAVYARVQAPDDGLRAWVEVARAGALPGLHQFLTVPYQGIAYLFGLERAIKIGTGTLLLTGEGADLEQPTDIRGQPTQDFYTSSDIAQGWTQRGQLLGDGTGPGSQSQWLSADWLDAGHSMGFFVERVRWNEDAFLRQYLPYLNRHDVTLRVGVRGGGEFRGNDVHVELSGGRRLNYQFQNGTYLPGFNTVDAAVSELRISIVPHGSRSR